MPVSAVAQYEKGQLKIHEQDIDWETDTFHFLLLDDVHTPDLANHEFLSQVVADECTDPDYNKLLDVAGRAINPVGSNVEYHSNPVEFGTDVTIGARYLVVAKWTGADGTSPLLWIVDLTGGGNANSQNGIFRYTPSANGWVQHRPNQ